MICNYHECLMDWDAEMYDAWAEQCREEQRRREQRRKRRRGGRSHDARARLDAVLAAEHGHEEVLEGAHHAHLGLALRVHRVDPQAVQVAFVVRVAFAG